MVDYAYLDEPRPDIYRMIPADGKVIGTIGCGRAATEAQLVREGREVHGVDVSAEAIATARRRLTAIDFASIVPATPSCTKNAFEASLGLVW